MIRFFFHINFPNFKNALLLFQDDGDILCDFENACLFRNSPLNKYTWTRHTVGYY